MTEQEKILADPDIETEAGRLHPEAPRFYIDHGMIHDRVTGKHVTTAPDDETWNGQTISHTLALLNELADASAPVGSEASANK